LNIDKARELVAAILDDNKTGHGMDHIDRVYRLAAKFAERERADTEVTGLAALLHDVDDYKIVGAEKADLLANSRGIMAAIGVPSATQQKVLDIIGNMGYTKYLKGIRPDSLEGMIVSDADMCDAIGANGIIRSVVYAVSDMGNGRIFDRNIYPLVNITSKDYNSNITTHDTDGAVNHFFEKTLKLYKLMMTESGRREAEKRHEFVVSFLRHLFEEEDTPEWNVFLDEYLSDVYEKK